MQTENRVNRDLDAIVAQQMGQVGIPGVVLGVERHGRVIHRRAYGSAVCFSRVVDKLQDKVPLTVEHVFDLASLTKVFATTMAVMILVDRGVLHVDDPVGRYVSGFASAPKGHITIANLLNHTAGLAEWYPLYLFTGDPSTAIERICSLPLKYSVGEARHYSDLGFMVLAHIVETLAVASLDRFLAENLFLPLGLRHTFFAPSCRDHSNFAATSVGNPYEREMIAANTYMDIRTTDLENFDGWRDYLLRGEVNDMNSHFVFGGVAGHAGLFSSVDDLLVLGRLIIRQGRIDGREYITAGTIKRFINADHYKNGLGWVMEGSRIKVTRPPAGTIGHTGFTGTSVVLVPTDEVAIVVLTNRQQAGCDSQGCYPDVDSLRRQIAARVAPEFC